MNFNKEELQLISDGLHDTLTRLKERQIVEDFETYTSKIVILKRKVKRLLNQEVRKR